MIRLLVLPLAFTLLTGAQEPSAAPTTDQEREEFLRTAQVGSSREISVGVTHTRRATLTRGGYTHDAHVQNIDETKQTYRTDRGSEVNFRDSYKYNIAAYKLDRLLGLKMMPVTIQRSIGGRTGSLAWWVDDVQMMELDRYRKKMPAPDPDAWNRKMNMVRIFNELTYDTDPNLGNLLIDKDWNIWIVDKTRAFRLFPDLRMPKNLENVTCDRQVYGALKKLDQATLEKELMPQLTKSEVRAVLARRDKIIGIIDSQIASRGEATVLYDRK